MALILALLISTVLSVLALSGFIWFWAKHKKSGSSREVNKLAGALLSKEVQSEILIESITDGIIVTDTAGKVTLVNKAAVKMTQWPAEEAIGFDARVVLRLIADEKTKLTLSEAEHPFSEVLQKRQQINKSIPLLGRQNGQVYISLVISPVIIPGKDQLIGAVAVFRDISASRSEEQRRAEFISTASHEMRTPVAAIEGYLALALNEQVSKIDHKAREYLEKAHSSTQHLGQLFQDLLTSAKAEDGRLTSHPVVIEMGSYIEQLADDLKFSAQKKGLAVEFITNSTEGGKSTVVDARGVDIHPLYYVHADPDRIREVITNLFDNAVKYTEQGKVSLGITGNNEVVQIRVADTGPGIPANDISHLFQKFYRIDNSATRSIGGTGLGLFICRKIIELYKGTIWAESTVGKGSTFYINLPRLTAQRAAQLQTEEQANSLQVPTQSPPTTGATSL